MAAAPQQSFLAWTMTSLGPFFGPAILLSGLIVFAGACVVVLFQRRAAVIAAYLVFVPLPLLLGLLGMFWGAIQSFSVIAASPVTPKPSEVAAGVSTCLFSALVGLIACFPAYLTVALGLLYRTLRQWDSRLEEHR